MKTKIMLISTIIIVLMICVISGCSNNLKQSSEDIESTTQMLAETQTNEDNGSSASNQNVAGSELNAQNSANNSVNQDEKSGNISDSKKTNTVTTTKKAQSNKNEVPQTTTNSSKEDAENTTVNDYIELPQVDFD